MTWRWLLLYLFIGTILGMLAEHRSTRRGATRAGHFLLSLTLWPLWSPISLLPDPKDTATDTALLRRIRTALTEACEISQRSLFSNVLTPAAVAGLLQGLERLEERRSQLQALLSRPDYQLATAPTQTAPSWKAQSIQKLHELLHKDEATLQEILELAEALRTQLTLARFSGQLEGDDLGGLVTELCTRVESLDELFTLALPNS